MVKSRDNVITKVAFGHDRLFIITHQSIEICFAESCKFNLTVFDENCAGQVMKFMNLLPIEHL